MSHTRFFSVLTAFLFVGVTAYATHNRAGEIAVRQTGDRTVVATIITYTKASSRPADRDSLTICWGDGACERVARSNGPGSPPQGEQLGRDYKKNSYIASHTYSERGIYTLSMTDPNRNGGILNVNFPNSDQVRFHIQTTLSLLDLEAGTENYTPLLLGPPIDLAVVGQPFVHVVSAFDPEGDSLSYELAVPFQDLDLVAPNYQPVTAINPGPDNTLSLDPVTGKLVWNTPQRPGEYNLAIWIVSYRDGVEISRTIRDMQIVVQEGDVQPPALSIRPAVSESLLLCVAPGDTVEWAVASDPGITLSVYSGLTDFGIPSAEFFPNDEGDAMVFRWMVAEELRRDAPYQVTVKAQDSLGVAAFITFRYIVKACTENESAQRITGLCFRDLNQNGTKEVFEPGLPGVSLTLSPDGLNTFADAEGKFTFYVPAGSYTLGIEPDSCWTLTTSSETYAIAVEAGGVEQRNFGFRLADFGKGNFQVSLTSAPTRCGREAPFWLSLRNRGCVEEQGRIALIIDNPYSFVTETSELPDEVQGDTLWWDFDPLPPGGTVNWTLLLSILGPDFLGSDLDYEVLVISGNCQRFIDINLQEPGRVYPREPDICTRYRYTSELLCSFDPNDKLSRPLRGEEKNLTLFSDVLEYTIRFQNTGNDTAFLVVLRDTLDPGLDWNTFRPFTASHPYDVVLDRRTGELVVTFRDINLPDSTTNEAASHGFFTYTLASRPDLAENTLVQNRAGIYFDLNPSILTNTTRNTLVSALPGTTALRPIFPETWPVTAFPNPFSGDLHFSFTLKESVVLTLEVFDVAGRRVYATRPVLPAGPQTLTVPATFVQTAGVYMYKLTAGNVWTAGRVMRVKE